MVKHEEVQWMARLTNNANLNDASFVKVPEYKKYWFTTLFTGYGVAEFNSENSKSGSSWSINSGLYVWGSFAHR